MKFLIAIFSLCVFSFTDVQSQIVEEINRGLLLSYSLSNSVLEDLYADLRTQGFEVHSIPNMDKEKAFLKYLDNEKREILMIIFQNGNALSISHYHFDKGSDFVSKVRSVVQASDYFKFGKDEDEFIFCLQNDRPESCKDTSNCYHRSKVLFTDGVVIFMAPEISIQGKDMVSIISELSL